MPWTDWKNPSATAVVTSGTQTWSNPTNAYADDGSYASITGIPASEDVETRSYTDFGFTTGDLPSGATILGIEVRAQVQASENGLDFRVQTYDATNGASGRTERRRVSYGNSWDITTYDHFGGAGFLWAESSYSDSDIRATTFGVHIDVDNVGSVSRDIELDEIAVRVYYRETSSGTVGAVPVVESWAASDSGGSVATSLSLSAPSGISSGDTLMLMVVSDDNNIKNKFAIDDDDWDYIGEGGSQTAAARVAIFIKPVATGSEGAVTVYHESSDELMGWYLRLSGVDTDDYLDSASQNNNGSTSSHTINGITTERDNCLGFYVLGFDGADGDPFGQPTGWTEQDEHQSGTGSSDVSGVWGTQSLASAGAVSNATVSSSISDGSACWMFALKPTITPSTGLTINGGVMSKINGGTYSKFNGHTA